VLPKEVFKLARLVHVYLRHGRPLRKHFNPLLSSSSAKTSNALIFSPACTPWSPSTCTTARENPQLGGAFHEEGVDVMADWFWFRACWESERENVVRMGRAERRSVCSITLVCD